MKSKMNSIHVLLIVLFLVSLRPYEVARCRGEDSRTPAEVVISVADKIISESSFEFVIQPQTYNVGVEVVDFQELFGNREGAVAYALTYVNSAENREALFGLSCSSGLKMWINDRLVFNGEDEQRSEMKEIAYNIFVFPDTLQVNVNKGLNRILVKSVSREDDWDFLLRPMTEEGDYDTSVHFTADPMIQEMESVTWLCIGPFPGGIESDIQTILDTVYPPEEELKQYYIYDTEVFVWIPKPERMLLELKIDPSNSFKRDSYLDWHYAHGGTMFGMLHVADYTGQDRFQKFVGQYCDFMMEHLDYFGWQYHHLHALRGSYHKFFRRTMLDDTGAACLPVLEMYLREGIKAYRNIIDPVAVYVSHEQVRLEDGTFCRPEPVPMTVWADDLFMSLPFLVRMGKMTGESVYYDDAARQVLLFAERLYNPETGLFYHGWFQETNQPSVAFWGRANGWVIWALSEALAYLPEDHPQYQRVLNVFRDHIEGLSRYQGESGMWHQVLDHPESYEETSCTAMFVLGMARGVRQGWIDAKYREHALRGWTALKSKSDTDGTVHGICRGTGMGYDLEFYFKRPTFDHDPRGLGAVMVAGSEIGKLLESEQKYR